MKKSLLSKSFFSLAGVFISGGLIAQTTTFSYTGSADTYTVPSGVTSIQIEVSGGQGGLGDGGSGGLGANMIGTFTVTPGAVLDVIVGGQGVKVGNSGSGGGGTGVINSGTPMIIAGGGGGGAFNEAGKGGLITTDGGASSGAAGTGGNGGGKGYSSGDCGWGAGGGGFSGNGYGGDGSWDGSAIGVLGGEGGGYSFLAGGAGGTGSGCDFVAAFGVFGCGGGASGEYGGGGGGGYSGGGGGHYIDISGERGGGGGGSINNGTDQVNTPNIHSGNGEVIITVLCSGLITTVSSDSICEGEEVILYAESPGTGTISWDGGVSDSVAFTPSVGTTTYTATSTDPADCSFSIDIFVGALPTVDAGTDVNLCEGDTVLLHGMGTATDWSWDGGITDSVYFTPGAAGTTTYTLTGTIDSTGCMAMDMVDVTYNVIDPSVTVTGVTLTAAQAGATYQWVNCPSFSLIGGATNQAFAPSQDGSYAVIINLNGCIDTSACETIAGVGISDLDNLAIKVLPNPNNGTFQLSLGQAIDGTIVIFGLDGKIIRSEAIAQRTNIDFSFENLDAGVYMMQLNTALGNSTVRIVVQ